MSESESVFNVTELELVYRPQGRNWERPQVRDADLAQKIFRDNWREGTMTLFESCYAMFLDNAKRVIGMAEISKGGFNATIVDPRIVFGYAIKAAASSILIAHNHPSGHLSPSHADIRLTERLKAGGEVLSIDVDDHLILTPDGQYISIIHDTLRSSPF